MEEMTKLKMARVLFYVFDCLFVSYKKIAQFRECLDFVQCIENIQRLVIKNVLFQCIILIPIKDETNVFYTTFSNLCPSVSSIIPSIVSS